MLWQPEKHEPLTDRPWSESWAREAVRAVVADAEAALDPDDLWPTDERDLAYGEPPLKDIYGGAAGVAFALDVLRRRGHADVAADLAGAALRTVELWDEPDEGLFFGEAGILLVAFQLAPSDELADRLFDRVRANVNSETNEVMSGAPGTMIAAQAMHTATGDQRWRDAWSESAAELRRRQDEDGLWAQRLGGTESWRYLGPAHGAVGNVVALLQGEPAADLHAIGETLERTAIVEDGLANWPPIEGVDLVGRNGEIRVQWCHGAPGIVASASYLPEELLLAGAELTWQAGPHGKGPGLCHGTAGNGYALLKTFERTGDERWLDRARRFAMHALEQVERRGRGCYSLFTGDVGAALYAADCIDGVARFPIMDTLSD